MKSRKLEGAYLLVFKKGDLLVESLIGFCEASDIKSGFLWGLGAASSAEIGHYDLDSKRYHFQKLDQLVEIVSLTGNIATEKGKPIAHIHTVLADKALNAHGGHLKEATVAGTCEIVLRLFNTGLERKYDDETGLKLLDL